MAHLKLPIGPLQKTASEAIFSSFKTTADQTVVTIEEVIEVLQRILHGLMKPAQVEDMVITFSNNRGLSSELSSFNEREFKQLMNRIIDDLVAEMDVDNNGSISKAEFYQNMAKVYGWQCWLAKRAIHKTFENCAQAADTNGDGQLSRNEIKELLRKFAVGELAPSDLVHKSLW